MGSDLEGWDMAEGAAQGMRPRRWQDIATPDVRLMNFDKTRSISIRPTEKTIIISLRQSRFGARRLCRARCQVKLGLALREAEKK